MNNLFIGVDLQYDFIENDGALSVPNAEHIKPIVKKISKLILNNEIQTFYTMDWHTPNDPELSDTPDYINTFPPHCIENTKGALLIPETIGIDSYDETDLIYMPSNIKVFHKQVFSVFKGNDMFLRKLKSFDSLNDIFVYGVAGDVCVKHVIDGLIKYKGIEFDFDTLFIIDDCIASLDNFMFKEYTTELHMKHDFIKHIYSREIC